MTRVFIGSTGYDLREYREAAIEVCNRLGMVPRAMEYFESVGIGATEGSLHILGGCDVYVGIFAHRYGTIEKGRDLSVTELEFRHAGERDLERLCFLVDEQWPWPPEWVERGEAYLKLVSFKAFVNSAVIRSVFTDVNDFRLKLIHSLNSWQKRRDGTPGSGERVMAAAALTPIPPRPPLLIGREEAMVELRRRLGLLPSGGGRQVTIVRGWPGVGKTTLINALAHDPEITTTFPDGLVWIVLGESPKLHSELIALGRRLGLLSGHSVLKLEDLIGQLRAFFACRQALFLVDDVWRSSDASLFKQIAGSRCCFLATTRFRTVASELADFPEADIYTLEVLSEDKGLEVLECLAPSVSKKYPEDCRRLVGDLEGLPLALRVAGRLLAIEAELGLDIQPLFVELQSSHRLLDELAPDDRFDPQTGTTPTVDLLLRRSTDQLDPVSRDRFARLGVFAPKPATFDLAALSAVWGISDPLNTVRTLVDRGLLEPLQGQRRFQVHAILILHAQSILED